MTNLRALEAMGLHAYIPVAEWEPTRPYFRLNRFAYDAARDVCPQGQLLRYVHTDSQANDEDGGARCR